jgi:hypothetical protein
MFSLLAAVLLNPAISHLQATRLLLNIAIQQLANLGLVAVKPPNGSMVKTALNI